jgi:hypothetical protein
MQHSWTDFSNTNTLCSPFGADYSLYVTQIILILKPRRLGFNTGSVGASLVSLGQVTSPAFRFIFVNFIPPTLHTRLYLNITLVRRTSGRWVGHLSNVAECWRKTLPRCFFLCFQKFNFFWTYCGDGCPSFLESLELGHLRCVQVYNKIGRIKISQNTTKKEYI